MKLNFKMKKGIPCASRSFLSLFFNDGHETVPKEVKGHAATW